MRKILAIVLATALLLCSCGPRSYISISPHLDIAQGSGEGGDRTASTYAELKSAILRLVEQGEEVGTISLVGYEGAAEQDVRTACSEVTNSEPLGAYGVEYMSYTCVQVLANYEATISITYSRSEEEMASVQVAGGLNEFKQLLAAALDEFAPGLAVELAYYSPQDYDVAAMVDEALRADPLGSVVVPSVEVALYPSSGLHRILEVNFDYNADTPVLNGRRLALEASAQNIASSLDGAADAEQAIRQLVSALTASSEFLPEREDDLVGEVSRDSTFTAYGALVDGAAASEGYALAFAAICELAGIDQRIVDGRWNGISHHWNLVELEGSWYHVDAALCDYYQNDGFLLTTDEQVSSELKWPAQGLPETATEPLGAEAEPIAAPSAEPIAEE